MMGEFRNKVCVVTGGSNGIGKHIALQLAKRNAIIQVIDISINEETLRDLKSFNPKNNIHKCSVTSLNDLQMIKNKILSDFDHVDYLVNNAGIVKVSKFEDQTEEDWKNIFSVNIFGVMNCTQVFGKEMIKNKKGKIVNIASTDAMVGRYAHDTELGVDLVVAYSASKGAVISFTKSLAVEWAKYGINVNAVSPILVQTPMTKHLFEDKEKKDRYSKELPLGVNPAMEDIGKAVVLLLSELSDKITGQILKVDCGYMARGEL